MSRVRKLCDISLLIAVAVIFQLVEASIPLPFVVPGFKLGLANCVALVALYRYDVGVMASVGIMRVLLASLMRGTLFQVSFMLSFAGMFLSSIAMFMIKRFTPCSIYGISIGGSGAHVLGQVLVIMYLYGEWRMISILPLLTILAIPTGYGVAFIAKGVLKRL